MKYLYTIFLPFLLLAQMNLLAQEEIQLHIDKPLHVLGDQLWFKAYLNPGAMQATQQLRVDLFTTNGQLAASKRLPVENQSASGSFDIALDWEEGWYTLRAYTIWGTSPAVKSQTSLSLPIYNEFKEREQTYSQSNQAEEAASDATLLVQLDLDKVLYERRDNIRLSAKLLSATGKAVDGVLSVSVIPKEEADLAIPNLMQPKVKVFQLEDLDAAPEAMEVDYGQINQDLGETRLLAVGMHNHSNNQIEWKSPLENGLFAFENKLEGQQQFQAIGFFASVTDKVKEIKVKAYSFRLDTDFDQLSNTPLPYSMAIENYLEQSRQRKKYGEIFEIAPVSKIMEVDPGTSLLSADEIYNTADFSNMIDVEEFLKEVVPFTRLRKTKNGLSIRILNENKVYYEQEPVYMIDGWLSYDQDAALDIPIKEIKRIELFRSTTALREQFGVLGNAGVISFYTTNKQKRPEGVNAENIVGFNGLSKPKAFEIAKISSNRTPDFRSLIFWSDFLSTSNGEVSLNFSHGDDTGAFTIIVKAMSASGEFLEGKVEYEVK